MRYSRSPGRRDAQVHLPRWWRYLRWVRMQPNAQEWRALAVRRCVGCQTGGNRYPRVLAAGCAAGSSDPGCRGSAPTETPHPRWRGLGPDPGRTAAGGSASGPAITTADRCLRRLTTSSRLTTVAGRSHATAARLFPRIEQWESGAERAASIIRRHSCAWQAVSDSQARSSGSSSRPSGVIRRSPRKEKPAQGPVKSIRWCGSNSIMPRSHPWPGTEDAGKSRARGPAIATRSQQRPRSGGSAISHNVYYVLTRLTKANAARAQPTLHAPRSNGRPDIRRTAPRRPSLLTRHPNALV